MSIPTLRYFVGDSLAGNDTVNQSREFFEHTKFDGSVLTKSDADARGGAALSIVKITSTPILYVGTGQEYGDLKKFDKKVFLETVFGSLDGFDLKDIPKPEPKPAMEQPEPEQHTMEPKPAMEQPEPEQHTMEPKPAMEQPELAPSKDASAADPLC